MEEKKKKRKEYFCHNCGESLGYEYVPYPDRFCGAPECMREARGAADREYEEACERAHDDIYGPRW